jgi:hypothetical protein
VKRWIDNKCKVYVNSCPLYLRKNCFREKSGVIRKRSKKYISVGSRTGNKKETIFKKKLTRFSKHICLSIVIDRLVATVGSGRSATQV